jgi:hypothetical protein
VSDNPGWFAPKRFGIGAGLPLAWQGWAILGAYLAALFACILRWGGHAEVTIAIMLPLTMLLLLVSWRTTRGGWRWRWGKED